jgi:integrase
VAKLTKTAVENLATPSKGQAFLWDSEIRGFGVRIIPSGLKTFIIQYRTSEEKSRRIKIGRFPLMTVEQARQSAKIKLGLVAAGEDPAEQNSVERGGLTVADVCDWYLQEAEAGRILGRKNRPIKASTIKMDASRITTHIKPLIGTKKVTSLRIVDIEGMQADIAAGKTAKRREGGRGGIAAGGPGVAGRSLSTLQSILGHASRLNFIAEHPSRGARRLAGKRKRRRLSEAEIKRLGAAMQFAERNGENNVGLAVVRFLLLTGFRISEGQQLQRAWLHANEGYVAFPDTKGDAQIRAIGRSAAEIASSQPSPEDSIFVFPATIGNGAFTAAKACLERLCVSVGLNGITPHTLRHTFGSVAGDLGFSELTIAALLGHATQSVTQGYVHVDEALKLAVEKTSERITRLLTDGASEARAGALAEPALAPTA